MVKRRPTVASLIAVGLLAFMAALAWETARRATVAIDETAHIGAGLSYLQKFDLRLNEEHPPLAKIFAALPLVIAGTRADYAGPVWTKSDSFFSGLAGEWIFGSEVLLRWNDARRTLALARFPMLVLTLTLGWLVFLFGRRLGGSWGGLLCLTVYVSSPLFLGIGTLVMTDVALALFALLTTWSFASLWREPSRRNTVLFGLALAAAILSKFSSGILFFAMAAFIAISFRWPMLAQPFTKPEARAWRNPRLRATFQGILLAAASVYVFYLIFSWNQPMDIPGLAGDGWGQRVAGRMLMPPWVYLRGIVLFVSMAGRSSYILGHDYWHGVWFYFPVLLVLKSAPGFLGLLAMLPVVWLCRRRDRARPLDLHWRVLWVTCVVFTGTCVVSHYNTDFRHFIFPVTLMILLLARLPRRVQELGGGTGARALAGLSVVLAMSCLVTAARAYPHYIPYVSAFGGGRPAWTLVAGTNLDVGQSLNEVAEFAQQRGLKDTPIDSLGLNDVRLWVPSGRQWDCQTAGSAESDRWVVVSANKLAHGQCAWLLRYPHRELGGGSMFAIRLPTTLPAAGSAGRPIVVPLTLARFGLEGDLPTTYMDLLENPDKFPEAATRFNTAMTMELRRKFRIFSARHGTEGEGPFPAPPKITQN